MAYANTGRPHGAGTSVPISGTVLGVAGIGAGVILGLEGMHVSMESEIAPVLDTAEAAGASYEEISALEALIRHNVENGIEVVFGTERGSGTMGQYDPSDNQILITPEGILDVDSDAAMRTLLHETTHAHQDAADGLENDSLATIGIDTNAQGLSYVEENYTGLDPHSHALEVEANSSEYQIDQTFEHLGIDV